MAWPFRLEQRSTVFPSRRTVKRPKHVIESGGRSACDARGVDSRASATAGVVAYGSTVETVSWRRPARTEVKDSRSAVYAARSTVTAANCREASSSASSACRYRDSWAAHASSTVTRYERSESEALPPRRRAGRGTARSERLLGRALVGLTGHVREREAPTEATRSMSGSSVVDSARARPTA